MTLKDIIAQTRSYRRFYQDRPVSAESLKKLIELARLAGSARNLQPLKYMVSTTKEQNARIFPHLGWAGYLKDWPGPEEGERPSAYIFCFLDTDIAAEADCDLGIATQNILLGATEIGLGGCRIASFSKNLPQLLQAPEHLKLLLVLAIGVPREEVIISEAGKDGEIRYWRDDKHVHHVPKRNMGEILIE